MKKLLTVIIIIFAGAGCADLKRVNPTDPAATNYIGMHYTSDIGKFVALSDIETGLSGGQAYVFGTDETQQIVLKYDLGGSYIKYWLTQDLPTGICADSASNIYVVDIANYLEAYTAEGVSLGQFHFAPGSGGGKIACDGAYLYAATSLPPKVYKYALADVALANPTPVASWGAAGVCDGCYSEISAVETDGAGNIFIADSGLNRITITDAAGNFIRKIELSYAVKGIALSNSNIYVPSAVGITQYDYTGSTMKKYADYGDGKGKVTAASCIAVYDTQVLIGNIEYIKVFKP